MLRIFSLSLSLSSHPLFSTGHIYAIGECGRAYEEARCTECHSVVGGQMHQLAQGNAWAPEMDGAEVPVWADVEADEALARRLQAQMDAGGE